MRDNIKMYLYRNSMIVCGLDQSGLAQGQVGSCWKCGDEPSSCGEWGKSAGLLAEELLGSQKGCCWSWLMKPILDTFSH